ncbi:helix-turn-helix domain-containing protein [Nocardioides zeae]
MSTAPEPEATPAPGAGDPAEPATAASGSQTLERGLAVLLELGRHPEGLTLSQVATAAGLHRSITRRLLVSLDRTGFATKDSGGRYRVGPTAAELGAVAQPRLRETAGPVLHVLARTVGATACLVEASGEAAVTTVVAEPPPTGRASPTASAAATRSTGAPGVWRCSPPARRCRASRRGSPPSARRAT